MRPRKLGHRPEAINPTIDQALWHPAGKALAAVIGLRRRTGTARLAERVRLRAAVLTRRERHGATRLLEARDTLTQAIYADAAPRGWCSAWSDGAATPEGRASIGALLLDGDGRIAAWAARPAASATALQAELAALEAVLALALLHKTPKLCVHTDCRALVDLWSARRRDPRLERVRRLVANLARFELRLVPRLHNQPANRLARAALPP